MKKPARVLDRSLEQLGAVPLDEAGQRKATRILKNMMPEIAHWQRHYPNVSDELLCASQFAIVLHVARNPKAPDWHIRRRVYWALFDTLRSHRSVFRLLQQGDGRCELISPHACDDPVRTVMTQEAVELLLAPLPTREREIVIQHSMEDWSFRDIASQFKIALAYAHTLHWKAISTVRMLGKRFHPIFMLTPRAKQ